MCVKGSLVLVLVLDWTQCLPHGWLPKKNWVAGSPEMWGRWIQFAQSPRLWHTNHEQVVSVWCPRAGCIRLVPMSRLYPFGVYNTSYILYTFWFCNVYLRFTVGGVVVQ